jgi:hypothetical protein
MMIKKRNGRRLYCCSGPASDEYVAELAGQIQLHEYAQWIESRPPVAANPTAANDRPPLTWLREALGISR